MTRDFEEFRRRIDENPYEDFDGRDEMIATSDDCAAYYADAVAFEQKLKRALEVPVPAIGLPDLEQAAVHMDIDEFRRRIDENPYENFDGRDEMIATNEDCAAYYAEALAFEDKLKLVLEVPVPDFDIAEPDTVADTASVVSLDARRAAAPQSREARPMTWLALAASVTLAAIVGFRLASTPPTVDPARGELVAEVLLHMEKEREEMRVKTTPASFGTVRYVTSSAGSEIDKDIGLISYARSCVVNGNVIPHLVLQGKNGPITLLIMPDEPVDKAVPFEDEDFHGALVPVGETGSVAIIGRKGEPLDDIRETIADKIRLSI